MFEVRENITTTIDDFDDLLNNMDDAHKYLYIRYISVSLDDNLFNLVTFITNLYKK